MTVYNEKHRLAVLKYRQKPEVAKKLCEQEKAKYHALKEENPEKYREILRKSSERMCEKSRYNTAQNRHVRGIMRIDLSFFS